MRRLRCRLNRAAGFSGTSVRKAAAPVMGAESPPDRHSQKRRGLQMKNRIVPVVLALSCVVFAGALMAAEKEKAAGAAGAAKPWAMNATIIEACSCPMFCQCYFATEPASHAGHMEGHEGHAETYCRFNN